MAHKPTGNPNGRPCVYRYIDDETGSVKYVGIVHKSSLQKRLTAHRFCDSWALDACWRIEYFECENRSEAEAFESHLISLYGTDKYYNKAKKAWGVNRFLPDVESWWKIAEIPRYDCVLTMRLAIEAKRLIREGNYDIALKLLDCIEFSKEGESDGKNGQTADSN